MEIPPEDKTSGGEKKTIQPVMIPNGKVFAFEKSNKSSSAAVDLPAVADSNKDDKKSVVNPKSTIEVTPGATGSDDLYFETLTGKRKFSTEAGPDPKKPKMSEQAMIAEALRFLNGDDDGKLDEKWRIDRLKQKGFRYDYRV